MKKFLFTTILVASFGATSAHANEVFADLSVTDILTRRGLLQLSAGRFDKASRDFKSASKLNQQNEFAYLGEGYAALLEQDYESAAKFFNDCTQHDKAAPLAIYGLAMTKELSGDIQGAVASYERAAKMRPDWQAPRAELARVKSSI